MSFSAGALIMSNFVSHEDQGIGASLVMTILNYCMSLALGFGGTVASQLDRDGRDLLEGFRGAVYLAIGIASLGFASAVRLYFLTWKVEQAMETKGEGKAVEQHQEAEKRVVESA